MARAERCGEDKSGKLGTRQFLRSTVKMSWSSLLVVLVVCSDSLAGKPTAFINFGGIVCPREPQGLSRCLRDLLNTYIPRLARGMPEYGIPSCEPLLVPEVRFRQQRGAVDVESRYSDVTVRGPSTMRVRDISVSPEGDTVVAELYIPELRIKGRYQMSGHILMLPIEGEGLCTGNYSKVEATVTVVLGRAARAAGGDALSCRALDVRFRVGDAAVQLDNLFGGDERLGGAMNKFINENWQQVAQELQPALEQTLRDFLKPIADRAFSTLNADDILQ